MSTLTAERATAERASVEAPTDSDVGHFVCCADHNRTICGSPLKSLEWDVNDEPPCVVCDDLDDVGPHCEACDACPGCDACE